MRAALLPFIVTLPIACHSGASTAAGGAAVPHAAAGEAPAGTLAQIYYWRAKPGRFDEYCRYVRDVAEPIDREAQRRDAFISVTTYVTRDTASAWTHMRVFVLRDSAQLRGLSAQLDSAGLRLEPDAEKRQARSAYSDAARPGGCSDDRVAAVDLSLIPVARAGTSQRARPSRECASSWHPSRRRAWRLLSCPPAAR